METAARSGAASTRSRPVSSSSATGVEHARGLLHRGPLVRRTPAELKHQGFRITEKVAGIPTALMGEWGEGGPIIAFMGEYDALPGLSQEAGSPSTVRSRPAAMATAAATISWARRRCSRPPP